jgi:hypothetical protein
MLALFVFGLVGAVLLAVVIFVFTVVVDPDGDETGASHL